MEGEDEGSMRESRDKAVFLGLAECYQKGEICLNLNSQPAQGDRHWL